MIKIYAYVAIGKPPDWWSLFLWIVRKISNNREYSQVTIGKWPLLKHAILGYDKEKTQIYHGEAPLLLIRVKRISGEITNCTINHQIFDWTMRNTNAMKCHFLKLYLVLCFMKVDAARRNNNWLIVNNIKPGSVI